MTSHSIDRRALVGLMAATTATALTVGTRPAQARVTAFMQAVATAASGDEALSAFYRANGYQPIWTSSSARDRERREALLAAIGTSSDHGLPQQAYEDALRDANLRNISSERDLGRVEVELSRLFLRYARDVQTGVLKPSDADAGLVRVVPVRDRAKTLETFAASTPASFIKTLPPQSAEYARLMKGKLQLEHVIAHGGWGTGVSAKSLEPGDTGPAVVALRNRLITMGYMGRSATGAYDNAMQQAVQRFQAAHGLDVDGVAGAGTIDEVNVGPEARLASVLVALERERWMNMPLGERHVRVNLADFTAKIIDDDKVTFQTRAVVGANSPDRRSPEFSDEMEHMVINPTWNVPRSIAVKEYLPMMQRNPNAAGHLRLVDARGRTVPRDAVDFTAYTTRNFPFNLKQPPSDGNALGLVKFMFPNKYNIYLHDTPSKSLFARESRAFSHGCIRLGDPFDFAYELLSRQTSDPVGTFQSHLATRQESVIVLDKKVPVHLDYRTAIGVHKGGLEYRRDVYGRDGRIFAALQNAGVVLRAVES